MATAQAILTRITNIFKHPFADNLEVANVLNWQVIITKDTFVKDQKVIYFEPDNCLTREMAIKLHVENYLSWKNGKGRIKSVKIRGLKSHGFILPFNKLDIKWEENKNVGDLFSLTRYIYPIKLSSGNQEKDYPGFNTYTDIQNYRNYKNIFTLGEQVVITEKLHGTNCKIGVIDNIKMAGSRKTRKKEPGDYTNDIYWYPWSLKPVNLLLENLSKIFNSVVLYGEIYGDKIQSLHYGLKNKIGFAAFDLKIEGEYVNWNIFKYLTNKFHVLSVPLLANTAFYEGLVEELSTGNTTIISGDHIREGVVIKPTQERYNNKIGRVVLKYINDEYLFAKQKNKITDNNE